MADARRRQPRPAIQSDSEYVNVDLNTTNMSFTSGAGGGLEGQATYANMEPSPDLRYGARGLDNMAYSSPVGTPRNGYHPGDDIQLHSINPAFNSSGQTPLVGRRSRSPSVASSTSYRSNGSDDEIRQRENIASRLDPDSIMSLLPSRQLSHSLSRMKSTQSAGTLRPQRRRSQATSLRRARSTTRRNYENVNLDTMVNDILSDPTLNASSSRGTLRRRATIRQISGTIDTRRRVREQVNRKSDRSEEKSLGMCTYWFYELAYKWESFVESLSDFTYSLELWRHSIKTIEGNFGSGVTSYFLLLKWLLLLNIPVFLLTMGFITAPQLIYRPSPRYPHSANFSGWDLLTGGGWFTDTELYCGYYTNETFSIDNKNYYNMPLAYLFTSISFFIIILIVITQGMSKAYRQYFVTGDRHYNFFTAKVFCGWDFSITSDSTSVLKKKSIYLELAEVLTSHKTDDASCCSLCGLYLLRLFINLIVLAIIAGACYLIYYMYNNVVTNIDAGLSVIAELAIPLVIGGYNLMLPYMFSVLSSFERYSNPRNLLYVSLFRTFLMKASVMCVLCYFWLNQISCSESEVGNCVECWETFIGKEVYKLVIIDFILQSLATFLLEFIRRIGKDHCCQSFASPEFDIARNTMDLIQSQTYTWLGMYFAPLLMVINIFKLVLIFYVKKVSVLYNCKPSLRPWKAGLAKTVFLGILFLMYLICLGAFGYSIVQIEPSDTCGPFRDRNATYDVVLDLFSRWQQTEKVISTLVVLITSPGVIVAIMLLIILLVFYRRSVVMGYKATVKRLQHQITLEGKDKRFLLTLLQDAIKKRNKKAKSNTAAAAGTSSNGNLLRTPSPVSSPTQRRHVSPRLGERRQQHHQQQQQQQQGGRPTSPHISPHMSPHMSPRLSPRQGRHSPRMSPRHSPMPSRHHQHQSGPSRDQFR